MATRVWPAAARPEWTIGVTNGTGGTGAPTDEALRAADDAAIVAACVAGRREAFGILVERHQRAIYRLCYRFAGNHEDASDLAQDVFVRAYRALGGFKRQSAFATWLYRIAVNVCLNRVGARQPVPLPIDSRDFADRTAPDPGTTLLRDERARQVRAAITRLPPKQRATLILRVYHELPHDRIAAILGSSVGAVKANFLHALANLKKLLESR